jgi:hypothetical protein
MWTGAWSTTKTVARIAGKRITGAIVNAKKTNESVQAIPKTSRCLVGLRTGKSERSTGSLL